MSKILINEIFESIQGEGTLTGRPCLFIRVSKCNRQCSFCDTKYHETVNRIMSVKQLANRINKSKQTLVVFTGGEPMLYIDQIVEMLPLIKRDIIISFETNGDMLTDTNIKRLLAADWNAMLNLHFSVSPKEKKTYNQIVKLKEKLWILNIDIKVVTDLKLNKNMLKKATHLMPLSTFDEDDDRLIRQKVWNYCVKHKKMYSDRVHISVWGYNKKGI